MPRMENCVSGKAAEWYEKTGEGSSETDMCWACAEIHEGLPFTSELRHPDEPRGTYTAGVEHPPYEESCIEYTCDKCGDELTEEDN